MIRQAMIHAGGEGTRLRPITYEIPKPLVPVQGRPILTWQLRWFQRYGVERVLITVSPKWKPAFEKWKDEVQKEIAINIELFEEKEPMGTMGAMVHHLHDYFNQESIFITNGDELKGFDLQELAYTHEQGGYVATMGLVEVDQPQNYGVPDMDGTRVIRFREKPTDPSTNFVHAGLYAFDTSSIKEYPCDKTFLMFEKDLFPSLAETGRLGAAPLAGPWYDCGTIERWDKAIKEWQEPSHSS